MPSTIIVQVKNDLRSLQVTSPHFQANQKGNQFEFKDWVLTAVEKGPTQLLSDAYPLALVCNRAALRDSGSQTMSRGLYSVALA